MPQNANTQMTGALTDDGEWKPAGDSAARHYSGSRQIALPALALEASGLGTGDTVSLLVQEGTILAQQQPDWTQERRIREQGASLVLPVTKRALEAADFDTDAQEVAIEAREGALRFTPREDQGEGE